MHIHQIRVASGRTYNVVGHGYTVEKPTVELTAVLEDGDDPQKVAAELHQMAERFQDGWRPQRVCAPGLDSRVPSATPKAHHHQQRSADAVSPQQEPRKANQDPRWHQPLVPRPVLAKPAKAGRPTEKAAVRGTPVAIAPPEMNPPAPEGSRR